MRWEFYETARPLMQAGDVLAFGGKGGLSEGIKLFTRAPVSHVGIVLRRQLDRPWSDEPSERYFVEVIESTTLGEKSGVQTSRLSDRLESYGGEVWWLPLQAAIRDAMDRDAYFDFLFDAKGRSYDMKQALGAGFDLLDGLGLTNDEDFGAFFCSELVAGALEAAGAIGSVNASEITPIELCRWDIYMDVAQIGGDDLVDIPGFNSRTAP